MFLLFARKTVHSPRDSLRCHSRASLATANRPDKRRRPVAPNEWSSEPWECGLNLEILIVPSTKIKSSETTERIIYLWEARDSREENSDQVPVCDWNWSTSRQRWWWGHRFSRLNLFPFCRLCCHSACCSFFFSRAHSDESKLKLSYT